MVYYLKLKSESGDFSSLLYKLVSVDSGYMFADERAFANKKKQIVLTAIMGHRKTIILSLQLVFTNSIAERDGLRRLSCHVLRAYCARSMHGRLPGGFSRDLRLNDRAARADGGR